LCTPFFPLPLPSLLSFTVRPPPCSTLFPYTTLFRSIGATSPQVAPLSRSRLVDIVLTALPPSRRPKVLNGTMAYESAADEDLRRSEEHTSELQSRFDLVCRLLLEKKKIRSSTDDDAH